MSCWHGGILCAMNNILLIDDDVKLAGLLTEYFRRFDLALISAVHPRAGLELLQEAKPDLVVLDIMLPGMDGFEVCRRIRQDSTVPIIMLTARGELTDRVVGLELGADDYLPKPFEPRELVARIQTVLRRAGTREQKARQLRFKDLEINLDQRSADLHGKPISLTTMEYEALVMFASYPGKVFTRDEILNHLRGMEVEIFSRSVDILVSRIRQKLHDTSKPPRFIKTVWGSGYTFIGEKV